LVAFIGGDGCSIIDLSKSLYLVVSFERAFYFGLNILSLFIISGT
jgi:hypothetical protein